MKPRIVNLVATLAVSISASVIVILFSGLEGWPLVLVVLGILMGGQALRYFLDHSRLFNRVPAKPTIPKRAMEEEVRTYFDAHPAIAKRFLRMDEIAKSGRIKDALSIASSLKRERLTPIIRKYIDYKVEQYKEKNRYKR